MSDLRERLLNIISAVLDREITVEISDDTKLTDLDINSLSFIQIVVGIEKEFGIHFDDTMLDIESLPDFSQLEKYIDNMMN